MWADIKDLLDFREPDNNWSFHVRDAVEKLAILYDISGFQPTLILHIICQHLPDFVNEWAQFGGIWSLLEETIESWSSKEAGRDPYISNDTDT